MTVAAQSFKSRPIDRVHRGIPTSDGAGVKLTRMLGHQGLMQLDPFLMLDYFSSDNANDPAVRKVRDSDEGGAADMGVAVSPAAQTPSL